MATVGSKRIRVTRVFLALEEVSIKTCGVKIVTKLTFYPKLN